MKTLHISLSAGRSYDIHIERGLLARAGELIRTVYGGRRIAVITDSNVAPLYAEVLEDSLHAAGFETKRVVFPAGEQHKNMQGLETIYDGLLSPEPFTLTRSDLVVALGGGVTGDMGGFAAGTVLRGVPFVQIPTTLLSQVDSSVGGKVAIDLRQGKNLAGLFYQPKLVLIDPDTLDTLSDRVFFDGMGEVVKYGLIREPALWRLLEEVSGREALKPYMDEIIYTCCDCKRRIVENDELDTGERMLLNFGHTIGHAYEKLGRYEKYMHGEAVSCGMYAILRIGEQQGRSRPGLAARLRELLTRQGMVWQADAVSETALVETLAFDKKGSGGNISPVFVKDIGDSYYEKMPREQFVSWTLAMNDTPEYPMDETMRREIPKTGVNRVVEPGAPEGELTVPSSKSMSHRMIIAAALAEGESRIENLSLSADITATLEAVKALGASYTLPEKGTALLSGCTERAGSERVLSIDCGESGSTLRFMIPVALALTNGDPVSFTGHGRLMQRPLDPYFDLFDEKGIAHTLADGVLTVGGRLRPGSFALSGKVSSQFITGLLFALPLLQPEDGCAKSEILIIDHLESKAYVDMTLQALHLFGIQAENVSGAYQRFVIPAGQHYQPQQLPVEGDWSQAAFFLAYNAIAGKDAVRLCGLEQNSTQGDRAAESILRQYAQKEPLTIDASGIPDLIPALAAAAAFRAGKETRFVDAGRLRIKESDRITTTCRMLRAMGADIEEGADFIIVHGKKILPGGGIVDCANDHRIAMSAAVAAANCESAVTLLGTECVAKSYPGFWQDFEALGGKAIVRG